MEKKFNIVVGEDGTVKLPDAVLEKLEVKPGEEVRFEVDDNFYAVRLLSRIEAERLDYLNWMHNKHCPSIEEMIAESRKQAHCLVKGRGLWYSYGSKGTGCKELCVILGVCDGKEI